MDIQERIAEAASRFRRKLRVVDDPEPPPPSPSELREVRLREFLADQRATDLLAWIDEQLALTRLQRQSPEVRASHVDLLTLLGHENGLEFVKASIINWRSPANSQR